MQALLYIPWFKATAWEIPIPGTEYDLPIQPFGVLVAIGVLLGAKVAEIWGRRNDIAPGVVADMVGHVVISAFVGAIVLNTLFYYPERITRVTEGLAGPLELYSGLSSYGGFIGAVVGLLMWWQRRQASPIAIGEAACFAFPFGWVFGRTGCFVTHDHPGAVTDFFLAVDGYRVGLPPFEPRHDLGLYEAMFAFVICCAFLWLAREKRPRGFYMIALPVAYAPVRFMLDFLRAGPVDGGDVRYGLFTPGQYGSFLILGLGLFVWWWVRTRGEPVVPASMRASEESYLEEQEEEEEGEEEEPAEQGVEPEGESDVSHGDEPEEDGDAEPAEPGSPDAA